MNAILKEESGCYLDYSVGIDDDDDEKMTILMKMMILVMMMTLLLMLTMKRTTMMVSTEPRNANGESRKLLIFIMRNIFFLFTF